MSELRFGNADDAILRIAASQHGLVARGQLLEIGVSADSVDRRLKRGWFRAMHRGVYAVGPVLAPRAREMAAALACGSGAALSHRSAAGLSRLLPELPDADVAVTVGPGKHPRPVGIHLHRVRRLAATDVTTIDGIPVTTVARTLCDLGTCDEKILEQALAVALDQAMTSPDELESMLHRHRYRRGTARVRALLARDAGPFLTRSEAELRFLDLIRKAELPLPRVNARVENREVDFLWRAERMMVEIDGYAFHKGREQFERDRGRDAKLIAAGYRVMRITWRQLGREPEAILP
jgi:very-short-patch-repair endonuclease